jgi:hypothetical protein
VVHSLGEKSVEENAMALSASDAVHNFSVGTAQNTGIPSGRRAIGESVPQIDWRREGNWDPTFSGLLALFPAGI